ncbi:glycosyltransferase family 2 protein [Maribacter sp. HTCC2170]|uniref:glycosyltransferase family 2 protein n=1 Tax=Maribacter sp. (strain HTCC2170 / KCCM 42371) TaxID=313603 RepID=UPI00006B2245|nr:glycosyltransferase family 2 protein [Maribacter sp. HTCC2170]EAR00262.1 glycosyl transferase, group 2 family protein [Maribacter sp. HTCC2170]
MEQPLVSILIPFKNTEEYFSECLSSILSQQYKNWEVLAINDSSSDESKEIALDFSKKDSRFKVIENSGTGIIHALRTGYVSCTGQLITRMDSDDIMLPERIETMVNSLMINGKGHIAVGKVKYFSEQGISNGYERYEKWLNKLTKNGSNYSEIYKECVIPSPCWMVFKEDLDSCGAFESERYPEDYDLTFRFYENNLKCIPCDTILHHWRDYSTRTSRTSAHYAANYFLDIKLHYFLKLDYDPKRPLVVWGAGNKGKTIAKKLIDRKIDFTWICDNPNKIGKNIYGKKLYHFGILKEIENPQNIITVANEKEQASIKVFFESLNKLLMKDYFFFC